MEDLHRMTIAHCENHRTGTEGARNGCTAEVKRSGEDREKGSEWRGFI